LRRDPSRKCKLVGGQGARPSRSADSMVALAGSPTSAAISAMIRTHCLYLTPEPVRRADEHFDDDRSNLTVGVCNRRRPCVLAIVRSCCSRPPRRRNATVAEMASARLATAHRVICSPPPAIITGGCGFCTGFGSRIASSTWKYRPWKVVRACGWRMLDDSSPSTHFSRRAPSTARAPCFTRQTSDPR
jgi:hypothetical protein